jgi:mannobiose 2-epimerase
MQLELYKKELQEELSAILYFWHRHTPDTAMGGFYGKLDNFNKVFNDAPKGSVLNSRILWAFSSAFNLTGNNDYLNVAERAFEYIVDHFIDKQHGGVYWTVDHMGTPLDTKKQVYALAFAIYGLSEFYLTGNQQAKEAAIELYHHIIEHSYDKINGGYIEALSADWKEITDMRLSGKDANEKKSMNTHLHLLEGFANLYRIWANADLKNKIEELIDIFLNHVIDKEDHHLALFFDEKWNVRSNIISYGHDIEAAWLLQEAAEIIGNKNLLEKIKLRSVQIANAAAEGLDNDGGLWYEFVEGHLIKEKHSWPQAESLIGFFNAWQITGDESYLEKSLNSWQFIQSHILDKKHGEWFWGVKENYTVMNEDKVGIWKCPYHNSRACIELIKRIDSII